VSVPVIDPAPFPAGSAAGRRPGAAAVGRACTEIGFFHQPNYDAVVECLPSCCGPDNPPRYGPVTSGEHRLAKFLEGVGARA
jgi:isopenicillin N synthase-like dioxygenase